METILLVSFLRVMYNTHICNPRRAWSWILQALDELLTVNVSGRRLMATAKLQISSSVSYTYSLSYNSLETPSLAPNFLPGVKIVLGPIPTTPTTPKATFKYDFALMDEWIRPGFHAS